MASTVINAAATTINAKVWEKTSSDTFGESIRTARDMGQLRLNYSRLNMVTTLSEKETEDWFSFKTTSAGKMRLTAMNLTEAQKQQQESGDKTSAEDVLDDATSNYEKAIEQFAGQNLKVEVYTYVQNRQTLLATNDESAGKAYENFEQMMRGEYRTKKPDTFYVHVTTKDGQPVSENTLYALQAQMGDTYKHDYTTQETSVDYVNTPKGEIAMAEAQANMNIAPKVDSATLAAQGAADLLAVGYNNMAQMQARGDENAPPTVFSLLI